MSNRIKKIILADIGIKSISTRTNIDDVISKLEYHINNGDMENIDGEIAEVARTILLASTSLKIEKVKAVFNRVKDRFPIHVLERKTFGDGNTSYDRALQDEENKLIKFVTVPIHKITIHSLDLMCDDMYHAITSALADTGSYVGYLSASSIVSGLTQAVLSSFHKAGRVNKMESDNIPRMRQIIKDLPSAKTVTSFEFKFGIRDDRIKRFLKDIIHVTFKDVIEKIVSSNDVSGIDNPNVNTNTNNIYRIQPYAVHTMRFNMNKLRELMIPIGDIARKMFVLPGHIEMETDPNIYSLSAVWTVHDVSELNNRSIEKIINELYSSTVCGIPGIKEVIKYERNTYPKNIIIGMKVRGSNVQGLSRLPFVEPSTLTTDSLDVVMRTYGIVKTRDIINNELHTLLQHPYPHLKNKHIELLVDTMCSSGNVAPVNKKGMTYNNLSVLAQMSYEYPGQNILSFVSCVTDNIEDPVSKFITGNKIS